MDLQQIRDNLASDNPQFRLRGIVALKEYEPDVAAPILLDHVDDPELMVRSLIINGLGHKRTTAGFDTLLTVMADDADANIRAEAAGAISKYGEMAVPHLLKHHYDDRHWLSQMSIVLALPDLNCPDQLLEVIRNILQWSEVAVRLSAIEQLPALLDTHCADAALEILLQHTNDSEWTIRRVVAIALWAFAKQYPQAVQALRQMREDPDHRIVAVTLEMLLPE
jgi:HEAT repeat protein